MWNRTNEIRQKILQLLKQKGILNYTQLCKETGFCPSTIRVYVLKFKGEELVTVTLGGWQKPSKLVQITDKGLEQLKRISAK